MYLSCSHCGCEFLPTKQQLERRSLVGERAKSYCSAICQRAGAGQTRRESAPPKVRYPGVCATCSKTFLSVHRDRKYCTLRCYLSNPETQARLRTNLVKANAASVLKQTGREVMPRVEVTCLNCGVKQMRKYSDVNKRSGRKYCNSRCYREYMAKRFDRWMAAPQTIALPQGYDEFLTQNELPCLIEGCTWVGQNLGNHVNFSHGISAREFKRAAGFNVGSGLCTPAVSEILSSRPHLGNPPSAAGLANLVPRAVRNYRSLEGQEHSHKAYALINASPSTAPTKTCRACGKDFQPVPMGHGAKFCTFECRDQWYAKNNQAYRAWLTCGKCGQNFQGKRNQELRSECGLPVFCSHRCRTTWLWQQDAMRHRRPSRAPTYGPTYRVSLTCSNCRKDFQGRRAQELRSQRGLPVFCSRQCHFRGLNLRQGGDSNG